MVSLIARHVLCTYVDWKVPSWTHLFTLTHTVLEVCFAKNEYKGIEGNNVTVQLKATGEFVEPFKARISLSALPPQHPFKTVEAEEGTFEIFVHFSILLIVFTSHTQLS